MAASISQNGGNTVRPYAILPSFNANLQGKTAIITGSSRGIGAGIALELGRRGANVVVNYTSPKSKPKADALIKTISQHGSQSIAVQADISTAPDRQKLVEAALSLSPTKHIDLLIHNAGNGDDRFLVDLDEAFYDMQMTLNLKAPIFLTQACLPYIPRGGRIVIISSCSARMGVPEQTVYAASKAGTEALARVWATELGQSRGITVNCVNPGPVATDGYYNSSEEFIEALKPLVESTPAEGRVGEVRDVVPLVSFLCSEESRWVTGSVVSANGGLLFF